MKSSEIALLILAVLVVSGTLLILILNSRARRRSTSPAKPSPVPAPVSLADTYISLLQQSEHLKAQDAYRNVFNRAAPLYQTLLGLLRRMEIENQPQTWLAENVLLAFESMHPALHLNATGFQVELAPVKQVDTPDLRARLKQTSDDDLNTEIRRLSAFMTPAPLSFEKVILQTGPILFKIFQSAQSGKPAESLISDLCRTLENLGCLPRYFDDPEVHSSESLCAQFIVESAYATELPGLYIRTDHQLYLIGMCAGSVRGDKA